MVNFSLQTSSHSSSSRNVRNLFFGAFLQFVLIFKSRRNCSERKIFVVDLFRNCKCAFGNGASERNFHLFVIKVTQYDCIQIMTSFFLFLFIVRYVTYRYEESNPVTVCLEMMCNFAL